MTLSLSEVDSAIRGLMLALQDGASWSLNLQVWHFDNGQIDVEWKFWHSVRQEHIAAKTGEDLLHRVQRFLAHPDVPAEEVLAAAGAPPEPKPPTAPLVPSPEAF